MTFDVPHEFSDQDAARLRERIPCEFNQTVAAKKGYVRYISFEKANIVSYVSTFALERHHEDCTNSGQRASVEFVEDKKGKACFDREPLQPSKIFSYRHSNIEVLDSSQQEPGDISGLGLISDLANVYMKIRELGLGA